MTSPATADWALPQHNGPDPENPNLWQRIISWWAEFSLQTKLLAVATLVVEASRTQWRTFRASVTSGLVQRDATLFLSFSGQCDVDYFLFTAEGGKLAG